MTDTRHGTPRPPGAQQAQGAPQIQSDQANDAGEAPPIEVTPRAVEMGKRKLQEAGGDHVGIRVGVKGGGCSGLMYHFELADSVRDKKDLVMELDGLTLLVDRRSLKYLAGSQLDWNDGLIEYGFRWKNPNADKSCGCGTSFHARSPS